MSTHDLLRTLRHTLILSLAFLSGCGSGQRDAEIVFPERATKLPDLREAGSVSGRVLFHGAPPKRARIRMSDAHCASSEDCLDESIIVGPNGGLGNVALVIDQGLESYVFPYEKTAVEVDQRGCVYRPHVILLRCFQPVVFHSSDITRHNVKTSHIKRNSPFNFSMSQGETVVRQFRKPELGIRLMCDLHSWMEAWIYVVDHPYFAISGSDGQFRIPRLPPGRYRLVAIHEDLGRREFRFDLAPNQELRLKDEALVFMRTKR